jgi:hypothetical protein
MAGMTDVVKYQHTFHEKESIYGLQLILSL